jgi:hypothetical protein
MNSELYDFYVELYPLYDNPSLDSDKHTFECLVGCYCGAHFRIFVNNMHENPHLSCKNCGRTEFVSRSTHSAGVFNATAFRMR